MLLLQSHYYSLRYALTVSFSAVSCDSFRVVPASPHWPPLLAPNHPPILAILAVDLRRDRRQTLAFLRTNAASLLLTAKMPPSRRFGCRCCRRSCFLPRFHACFAFSTQQSTRIWTKINWPWAGMLPVCFGRPKCRRRTILGGTAAVGHAFCR